MKPEKQPYRDPKVLPSKAEKQALLLDSWQKNPRIIRGFCDFNDRCFSGKGITKQLDVGVYACWGCYQEKAVV